MRTALIMLDIWCSGKARSCASFMLAVRKPRMLTGCTARYRKAARRPMPADAAGCQPPSLQHLPRPRPRLRPSRCPLLSQSHCQAAAEPRIRVPQQRPCRRGPKVIPEWLRQRPSLRGQPRRGQCRRAEAQEPPCSHSHSHSRRLEQRPRSSGVASVRSLRRRRAEVGVGRPFLRSLHLVMPFLLSRHCRAILARLRHGGAQRKKRPKLCRRHQRSRRKQKDPRIPRQRSPDTVRKSPMPRQRSPRPMPEFRARRKPLRKARRPLFVVRSASRSTLPRGGVSQQIAVVGSSAVPAARRAFGARGVISAARKRVNSLRSAACKLTTLSCLCQSGRAEHVSSEQRVAACMMSRLCK